MNKRNIAVLMICAIVLIISVVLIGRYTGMVIRPAEREPIIITTSNYPPGRLLYLPLALDLYEEEGVNVIFKEISDADLVLSLASGHADLVQLTTDWFVIPAAEGIEAKELFYTDLTQETEALLVPNHINGIKELKGKKVALLEGTIAHYFLYLLLEEEGMKIDDIKIISMPPDKAALALVRGDVSGAVTWEPWLSGVLNKQGFKALYYDKDVELISPCAIYAKDNFIRTHQEELKAIIRAYFKGIEFWKQNPDKANKIMADNLGLSTDEFEQIIAATKVLDYEDNLDIIHSGYSQKVMKKSSDLWIHVGFITNRINPDEFIDTSLLMNYEKKN